MKHPFAILALAPATVFLLASQADSGGDAALRVRVRAMLNDQGHDVRRIDFEGDLYEAYALKDGKRMEVYVTASLQIVTQTGKPGDKN